MKITFRNKKTLAVILLVLTAFIFSAAAEAVDVFRIGGSAKVISLGRAFTAMEYDSSSIFVNPAGISELGTSEVSTMYANLSSDVSYTVLSGVTPLPKGTLGIGYIGDSVGDLVVTSLDANGRPISVSTFNYGSNAIFASYGVKYSDKVSLGANCKFLNKGATSISGGSASGIAIDLGMNYKQSEKLNMGICLSNIMNTGMTWGNGLKEEIAYDIKLGIKYKLRDNILVLYDWDAQKDRPLLMKGGVEWNPRENFYIRGGLEQLGLSNSATYTNYSAGVGMKFKDFKIDYAYYYDTILSYNSTSFISFSVLLPRFGFNKKTSKNEVPVKKS